MPKPNILFLMTDQQRFDHLGITNPAVQTPHLDALAKTSVFFTRAYSTNPVCVPARAAMFTGRYPSQTGVPDNATCLPGHERTYLSYLREAGYHTAVIGKQHFNGSAVDRGYAYEDIIDSHSPAAALDPRSLAGTRHDNSYQRFLYENGFRRKEELVEPVDDVLNRWKVEPRFHVDHYVGTQAVAWLRAKRPPDRPWHLCVSFPGPHGPVDGVGLPQEDLYDPGTIDLPKTDLETLKGKPAYYRHRKTRGGRPIDRPFTEEQIRAVRRAWYANVSLIDEQIGNLLQALENTGQYDQTMVVFATDHGDFSCDLNMVDKGPWLLDVLLHIPLVIKPPVRDFEGKSETSLVSSIDLPGTFLAAAGVAVPGNMRSRDLSRYWQESGDLDDREQVYMEANPLRGIRTRRWKLIHCHGSSEGELYDLAEDPHEINNLWKAPGHEVLQAELTRHLLDQVISLGADFRVPGPGSTSPRGS